MYSTAFLFRIAKAASVEAIGLMALLVAIGNITAGNVLLISFSPGNRKGRVIFSPEYQQARLVVAQPLLPARIRCNAGLIIVKQIQLDLRLTGPGEKGVLIHPGVRVDPFGMGRIAYVPLFCRLQ
jgi:hypothetical protein